MSHLREKSILSFCSLIENMKVKEKRAQKKVDRERRY